MSSFSRKRLRGDRGFTLIETLVAVAIFALSIPSIFEMIGIMTRLDRDSEWRRAALRRAELLLTQAQLDFQGAEFQGSGTDVLGQWKVRTSSPGRPGKLAASTIYSEVEVEAAVLSESHKPVVLRTMFLYRAQQR